MEEAGCALCGKKAGSRPYLESRVQGFSFRYLRCNSCNLVFLHPRPDAREILKYYAEDYYGPGEHKFRGWIETFRIFCARRRAARVRRLFPKPGRVLDVGCGQGTFLSHLRNARWEVRGTELSAESARRALQAGIPVSLGDIREDQFSAGSLDLVTLWQVFEHLADPAGVLRLLHRMLRAKGILVISTPNIDSLQARVFQEKWFHLDAPRHFYLFSPETLVRLSRREGFRLITLRHLSLEQSPYGWLQSFLNRMIPSEGGALYSFLKTSRKSGKGPRSSLARNVFFAAPLLPGCFLLTLLLESQRGGGSIEAYFEKET